MTHDDFGKVLQTMASLWPGKLDELTDEQSGVWRRVCDPHSRERCKQALRDFAVMSRWFPKPVELNEQLAKLKDKAASQSTPKPAPGRWQQIRAGWVKAQPHRHVEFMAMTDAEVEVHVLRYEFERSVKLYGSTSLSTIFRWQQWQQVLYQEGLRTKAIVTPHHCDEARRQFETEGLVD